MSKRNAGKAFFNAKTGAALGLIIGIALGSLGLDIARHAAGGPAAVQSAAPQPRQAVPEATARDGARRVPGKPADRP